MIIDTHIHLDLNHFSEDLDAVVSRAKEAGVTRMITVGTDLQSSLASVRLAETHEEICAAVGIHPHEASKSDINDIHEIERLTRHKKVVAVGEIGLDYHYDFSPPELQHLFFDTQLRLAQRVHLPVIVHVREAMQDALQIIDRAGSGPWEGVFHCFGGTKDDVPAVLNRGFHVSFTGVITFSNFRHMDAVRCVPLNRLILETDAPYMTPVPHRGKRNEPMYLPLTAGTLAEALDIPVDKLIRKTTENALSLFGLES